MNGKTYQMSNKQLARIEKAKSYPVPQMPTDDEFKAQWKKRHHGKLSGWGIAKRDWVLRNMKNAEDYTYGIWQGRLDALRGIEYTEERFDNTYNMAYYRGYTNVKSDLRGMDAESREWLMSQV